MHMRSDEALVAYLDGELDAAGRRDVEAWLDADPAVRERLAGLQQAGELVRSAYADIVDEPIPERLIAAAGGAAAAPQEAEILVLRRPGGGAAPAPARRWHIGLAAAAGLFGLMLGGGGTYVGVDFFGPGDPASVRRQQAAAATSAWLDNAAGYYKLMAGTSDKLIDVPASNDTSEALQKISQNLPQQVRLPNLKPWGLSFRGARLIVVEGRPAAQLVYATDNKAIGTLSLVIGATKAPDVAPTVEHREGVNLLYWRHHGRAYALAGTGNIGWLWGIANDVAWQLDGT
jgi:anti-sigma factor RsiW